MAKPDSIGVWCSREGYTALVWYAAGSRDYWAQVAKPNSDPHQKGIGSTWWPAVELPGDDWQKVELPTFEKLPDKPPLVFACDAKYPHGGCTWFMVDGEDFLSCFGEYEASELKVVPHPDNDPEAVRLIEEAKR